MKVKKHTNSRMRRSKSSKSRKGNKGRGRLTKTRRMRGRGLLSGLSGLFSGSAARSAAGYTSLDGPDIADGPSAGSVGEPEVVSNMPFTDSYGNGMYSGHVITLPDRFVSRQGTGKMEYADGTKYIGEYQGNKRNGTGTIYGTTTTIQDIPGMYDTVTEIRWNDDKPMNGTYYKKCYQNNGYRFKIPVFYGESIAYPELSAPADDSIGLGGHVNPAQIQEDLRRSNIQLAHFEAAMPKKPVQPPPSTPVQTHNYDDDTPPPPQLSPEKKEKRKILVAATKNSIANFDAVLNKLSKGKI